MSYQIGTDEAGYGPNLGPLTVCGTAWLVPEIDVNLYELLRHVVTDENDSSKKISICDSKRIYKSNSSLQKLETSVLAILYAISDTIPKSIDELSRLISDSSGLCSNDEFQSSTYQPKLPIASDQDMIRKLGARFRESCQRNDVELVSFFCRAVFPSQYNGFVSKLGNKAEMLSSITFGIVQRLRVSLNDDVKIVCDKHGGRNKYIGMINKYLTDQLISITKEASELSQYKWNENGNLTEINFQAKGESFLPTALSSMVAKYVRELSMIAWNRFWESKIPGIRPTKGYPVDARRFKAEISAMQAQLGIGDESIWRSR